VARFGLPKLRLCPIPKSMMLYSSSGSRTTGGSSARSSSSSSSSSSSRRHQDLGRHRVAQGTPVDQPGGKFLGDVWGHVVAPRCASNAVRKAPLTSRQGNSLNQADRLLAVFFVWAATTLRGGAAWIRRRQDPKSSSFFPDLSCAVSQRGCFPRPAKSRTAGWDFYTSEKPAGKGAARASLF